MISSTDISSHFAYFLPTPFNCASYWMKINFYRFCKFLQVLQVLTKFTKTYDNTLLIWWLWKINLSDLFLIESNTSITFCGVVLWMLQKQASENAKIQESKALFFQFWFWFNPFETSCQSIPPENILIFSGGIGKKYQPDIGHFLSWQKLLVLCGFRIT